MKHPTDTIKGEIVDADKDGNLIIKAKYEDQFIFDKREYKEVLIQMIDGRSLSYKQRNACYAMIRDIAEYTGDDTEDFKMFLKAKFMLEELHSMADELFSLSNAPMSLVCAFQRYIARFIVKHNIPTSQSMLKYVDDVNDYIYACLVSKKCCICGRPSDLHHLTCVAMGRNRDEIVHEGMEVMPLCREHHTEYHKIGRNEFMEKYHLKSGVKLDKDLCKLYGLKTNKELKNG